MITWVKLDAGEYESSDQRFYILKTYDRIHGNHWELQDRDEPDYYEGKYHEETLKDCKHRAEGIIKMEKEDSIYANK